MTYLQIINDGHIESGDIKYIGFSTKRGVAGKIGEFGSGNKFSTAWYFRNNCIPTIFSGTKQIKLDTKIELLRSYLICII